MRLQRHDHSDLILSANSNADYQLRLPDTILKYRVVTSVLMINLYYTTFCFVRTLSPHQARWIMVVVLNCTSKFILK